MMHSNFLRRSKAGLVGSAAPALVSRAVLLLLVGSASLLTLATGLTLASRGPFGHGHQHLSFIERTVGEPAGPARRRTLEKRYASSHTRVTLHEDGARIVHGGSTLTLAAAGAGAAPWQPRANGAIRSTPFGREAVVATGTRTESYLDVKSRFGVRTWRWHLGTTAVAGRAGTVIAAGMTIRPPAIYDDRGRNVTPRGTHWALARHGGVSDLLLRLDDSRLPVPYLIDPEVDYGSAFSGVVYLTTTASKYTTTGTNGTAPGGVTNTLNATSPGANLCTAGPTTGGTCPGVFDATNQAAGTYYMPFVGNKSPAAGSFVVAGSIVKPTPARPFGFIVDNGGLGTAGTVIPAGNWTFNVPTLTSAASGFTTVTTKLSVGAWVVTDDAATGITTIGTQLIDPTASVTTTDLTLAATARTFTNQIVAAVPATILTAQQHILVAFYAVKTTTANKSSGAYMWLGVNGSGTLGATAVSAANLTFQRTPLEVPTAPTALTAGQAGGYVKTITPTLSATYATPGTATSDQGRVDFFLCSTNADCSGAPFWSGSSSTTALANNASGSAAVPAATLVDGSTYYLEARGQATDPANNAPYSTAITGALTSLQSLRVDATAPGVTIATPGSGSNYGATTAYPTSWSGTATDGGTNPSGIAAASSVHISLQDPTGKYWNGAAWQVGATTTAASTWASPNWTWTGGPASLTTNGTYNVVVTATDAAGNATSSSRSFVYDTAGPNVLTATTPASAAVYGGTTAYPTAWAGTAGDATSGVSTVQVTLADPTGKYWNGASWVTQAESLSWQSTTYSAGSWSWTSPSSSVNGTYTMHLRATDLAGNVTTNSTYTFVYDNVVPNTLTIATPVSSAVYGGTTAYPTAWSGTAADATSGIASAAGVQITLKDPSNNYWNGASWQAGTTTVSASSLSAGNWSWTSPAVTVNGTYNVTVKATDAGGNYTSVSRTFVYDDVAPNALAATIPAANAYYGGTTAYPSAWAGTAGDATSPVTGVQVSLADPTGNYWNGSIFSGTVEAAAWRSATYAAGSWSYTPGANSAPGSLSTNGTYTVHLRATDQAGNTATNSTYTFSYDTVAPTTAITTPASGANYGGTTAYATAWNGSATDATSGLAAASSVQISFQDPAGKYWNGSSWQAGATTSAATSLAAGTWSWTAPAITVNGTYNVVVTTTDRAGNQGSSSRSFVYDDLAPGMLTASAPVANTLYGGATGYPTAWSGTQADTTTGVQSVQLTLADPSGNYWNGSSLVSQAESASWQTTALGSGTWSWTAPSVTANGTYTVHLRATDQAGNVRTNSTYTFVYDSVAPAYSASAITADGTQLRLRLTEAGTGLDVGSTTPGAPFTVAVNGSGDTVDAVSTPDATHVVLTLANRVFGGDTVTVAYAPASLTAAQKVKDLAGNALGAVSAQSVSTAAVASLAQSTVSAAPGSLTADGASTTAITVQLKNAAGTNLGVSGGTLTLATTDGSLGAVTDHGDGTYSATLTSSTTAHAVTVTAKLGGSDIAGGAAVTFAPGAAAKLAFGVQPLPTTAGNQIAPSVTVRVLDAHDNLVASSSASVSLAISNNPGGSTLSGTTARNAAGGVATFNDLSLNKTGTGYTVGATSGVLTGTTSTSFDISSAAASSIASAAGEGQSATVDTDVATAPSVLVTDAYGNKVAGVAVVFAVASGGGSATSTSATTNASGIAAPGSWKLGQTAGTNTLTATAGVGTVTFHASATAGAATTVAVSGGDGQSATVDDSVATAPSARVTDTFGNPVSGVGVTFAVASGGGSATGTSATTNASGIATIGSWKLGQTAGANSLTATSSAGSVTFHATGVAGTAGSLAANGGDNQTATVNTNVPTAPSVLVADAHANPVAGIAVTFAAASGGGSATGTTATTNASGVATVTSWKLGTSAGVNTLTASATGLTSVTFHATATAAAAASVAVDAGDNQSATVDTNVANAPSVRITDSFGNGVSGAAVAFAVASGGGSATGAGATTDASGVAAVGSWKLGTTVGANTLTATATVGTLTFHGTGTADSLDHLLLSPASASISADVGTQSYTAEGRDRFENSLGDATSSTTFTVGGGSCTGAGCTVTAAGDHTVTGTLLGATGLATLHVAAGTPATLTLQAGANQSATVDTAVATAPSVVITDAQGNPVAGVAIAFAVGSGGGSATGTSAVTNASGAATVGSWTLGTTAGANTLTATSGSLSGSPVTFTATGTAGAPATIARAAGEGQSATVETTVATAPAARVTDSFGNSVAGIGVTFAVASGGGSATGTSATTNAGGIATAGSWTLGQTAGANTLTATTGAGSVTFDATGSAGAATTIARSSGEGQSGTVDTDLSTAPSVLVADAHGNPVSGITVTFAVAPGGGAATGTSAATNASGIATIGSWKLGQTAGANTLTATASVGSVTFHATGIAGAAASIAVSAGDGQIATANTNVATAPAALVTDQFGNAVAGAAVTFAVGSGGGSGTGLTASTNASGAATAGSWKLGQSAGANTLTATASVGSVVFHATGVPDAATSIAVAAGDNQASTVDANVSAAPSVLVTDTYGNPVSGVAVTFAVASGGGTAGGVALSTGSDGRATVGSWKLGTVAGANTLTATAGVGTVTFHATGTAAAPSSIARGGGEGQSAVVDTNLSTAPSVLVTDTHGNPVPGIAVTFAVTGGGGSAGGTSATTDSNGVAAVGSWKLGTLTGTNTLSATATAGSVTFHATGVPGAAGAMSVEAGEGQSATVSTGLATAPSVLVTDAHGNAVAGVAVTFAVGSGGGSIAGGSATTDAAGVATVGSWTLGTGAGANTLTADAPGLSSVTFHATGLAGAAASIAASSGDNQTATVGTNVSGAPSVRVADQYGNPVAGATVTFAVASGAGSATGTSPATDASGIATVGSWQLGTVAGANSLTASSTGLTGSPVTFHATGVAAGAGSMAAADGEGQSATVDTTVATAPSVLVTDAHANPVAGVSVHFAVATGAGSVTGADAVTGADGVARVGSWKLGVTAGAGGNTLSVSSSGLPSLTIHATGVAGTAGNLGTYAGAGQSATVNANVAVAPAVRVTDSHGNPVSGVGITFAAGSGGSGTGLTATTGSDGVATAGSWKLATEAGANDFTATSGSLAGSPLTFHATGLPDAATALATYAGDNQSATVHTAVATAPAVKVSDQFGNGISGVSVIFAVGSGGGSATGLTQTTDAAGVATAGSWTLGTTAGGNTLSATATGLAGSALTLHATGTAGAASTIAIAGGDNQSATADANVTVAPSALLTDAYGNPVAGVPVTFAIASGGGSASGVSAATGANGVASVGSWKLGTAAGAKTLTATATAGAVTFHATATADAAASIARNAGEGQSATVDTNVATPPAVLLTDQFGNPVGGVAVTFAVASGGGSAGGTAATTNASGVATVGSWKLGTAAGADTITATANAGSVTFHATASAGSVDHLLLSPSSASVAAGQSQTYSVEGRDAFDNSIGDVTGATTLGIVGGTCVGAICSAPATGSHAVTGAMLGAVGNATLTITPGTPSQIAFVSPDTANLVLGGVRSFAVALEDAQGNVITTDSTTSIAFARSAGTGNLTGLGAAAVTSGTVTKALTASAAGPVTVRASSGSFPDASISFTIDPAPVATIDSAPSDPSNSSSATFDYSADDATAPFECRLDGAAYGTCPGTGNGSKSYTGLATGSHRFDIRAVTAAAAGPVASAIWLVDQTNPVASLTQPADGSYVTTPTRALAATATDTGTGVGAVDFEVSSSAGANCSAGTWTSAGSDSSSPYTATWTTPGDGSYAVRAVAHDGAGHSTCSLVHVVVDRTAPTATAVSPAANVRGSIALQATGVADATSGLNSVSFERAPDGTSSWAVVGAGVAQGGDAFGATFDTTTVGDGLYDFRVTVTDVAGNLTQAVVGPIRVDNTSPSSSMGAVTANVRQTVALTSSASDTGSGIASSGYQISPTGAGTWTAIPASFDTTTKTDGSYDIRAIATDTVGNVGHSTSVTTRIDNTPPAATLDAIARYVHGSLPLTSTTSDAGSALATVRYEISAHGAASWSTIASPLDTLTKSDGDYDMRVVAVDNAGNRTDSAAQLVTIDNTAPNAQLDSPAASAIARGAIDLATTVSDGTAGIATVTYRVAPAGTPEASPCASWGTAVAAHLDTTTMADGLYDLRVVAVDNAGNGRCSTINTNVRIDNTAPQTTDDAPGAPQNHDVTVHLTPTDAGSGVTSTVYSVDGGPQQTGTTVVIPASGNDGTHTIAYRSADAAGNVEAAETTHVLIDTTAPTGGAGNGGAAIRGDFVLTDSPADVIASVEFKERVNTSDPWTSIGADNDGTNGWHVTWHTSGAADGTHHLQMIETDDAGNPAVTPLADTVVDNTAPATAAVTVSGCAAECSGTNVVFHGSADASVSGIGAVDFQVKASGAGGFSTVGTQTSGFALQWNSTTVPDGPAEVRIAVTDGAGNGPTYSPAVTIAVDNNAPTVSATAPAAASGTIALGASGSADIQTVTYEISQHGAATWAAVGTAGAPAPFTFSWNTTARADGVYDVRAVATDGGGNTGNDVKTITIDNTAPTGAMTQPDANATVGGHAVALGTSANDAGGSGVAQVTFQFRAAGSLSAYTDITSGAWNAAALASGGYDLRARIVDNAGNAGFTATRRVTVDSTPPSLSLSSLPALLGGTVAIDANIAGATDAILQVRGGTGGWATVGSANAGPLTFAFDSSVVPDGTYDVRVVADDAFDNEAVDTRGGIRIDNTPPSLTSSSPADGSVLAVGTAFTTVAVAASEALSAVRSVEVDGDPAPGAAVVSGSAATIGFADVGAGSHYVTGVLVDTAGKSRAFRVNVSVLGADGVVPAVMKNAPASDTTLSTTADSSATVLVPAGAYTQPAGHSADWLVLRVVPLPPALAPLGGFETAGSILDVTMAWNSNGSELHEFDQPLAITLSDPTGGTAIPATREGDSWRLIPALAATTLPANQADGFYRDGGGVHVLTHHLSEFTLVRDIELPAPPREFSAAVTPDGLTLRWAPGIDQNRIMNFVLYVDGRPYRTFGTQEFEINLGAFNADDARSFSIAEINTSGISSAPTTPLLAVPSVAGRTVGEATAALAARGFTVGKLVPVVSAAPAGSVVGPASVQLLPAGAIVDLQVADGSVPRPAQFVLRIALQKRVRATSHALVARILATAPAAIAATLDGGGLPQRWSFSAPAGSSLHTLRLRHAMRIGTCTLFWLGRSADGSVFRTSQKLRVIRATAKAHAANPAQIILTVGPVTTAVQRNLQSVGQTLQATPEQTFDLAATRDASVIVVDADKYGLQLVSDLRRVFPTTAVVALSTTPPTLTALARQGALAVSASTPPATLARLVRKLARR